MKELEQLFFADREAFRNWLGRNHDKSPGIWMLFYKKHTNIESIKYKEALEEALCFGWIDSIIKRIDDAEYVRKFTPRINLAKWSEINIRIADEMIRKGRMTEAGLRKFKVHARVQEDSPRSGKPKERAVKDFDIPGFILSEFAQNEPALKHFNSLPKSHKRNYILWITTARREETIQKRLKESIALLQGNKRLGLK
jgi:uncharacterized protein YdeI (YjbR/CyaY-like superfamily)